MMSITTDQLRNKFGAFWEKRAHRRVPPAPLIPKDDPTTLFTSSGMQQLLPYLLGQTHPLGKRLYNIQPCLRTQDIEAVGDNRHTTFFEMLGNWSLGDYFKKDQLAWFWEFLTKDLSLPKTKLAVSIFKGDALLPADDESYRVWKQLGIAEPRIFRYDDNWWSRSGMPEQMPSGEPGGPDSEVFYEFTQVKHDRRFGPHCHPNCDCGRFLEIGNSVFMEYKKQADGRFAALPAKNIDFGGGLERMTAALNNDPDMFQTAIFRPIIRAIEAETHQHYDDPRQRANLRIVADHLRAAVSLIQAGVLPTNKEQGYVLRRLLRRSALKMMRLTGRSDYSLSAIYHQIKTAPVVNQPLPDHTVGQIIDQEVDKFRSGLQRGLRIIEKIGRIDGKIAFDLYQNFGFPLEMTEELWQEKGQTIDRKQFQDEFKKHKQLSRTASADKFKGGLADQSEQTVRYHTATHLIHQALFDVLGNDVRQEGSNITGSRLRFDFYSLTKPTQEQIDQVQTIVNAKIKAGLPVNHAIMTKAEALRSGAKSFFREKYPDRVKVYRIGDYSQELCGGPHVTNTRLINRITVYKWEKIGSNLYRLYAR
ncbi:alanine--tRNA ligase [Patescibacteria group bacterium]|nr:alanine--tRNA ligase [Patescibacteria group bacterium]MCL5091745.1 alanine--tRNA ligase [Patescibacteria group bacterium]